MLSLLLLTGNDCNGDCDHERLQPGQDEVLRQRMTYEHASEYRAQ